MSRLINYGPGDLSDRLTILSLKILASTEAGKDCTHFQTEQTALLQQIRSRTLNGVWFTQVLELAAVNAMLWHAEDDLREWRQSPEAFGPREFDTVRDLAFRIQALNDRRAGLVQQINEIAGEGSGQEKL